MKKIEIIQSLKLVSDWACKVLVGLLLFTAAPVLSQYDPGTSLDWECPCTIEVDEAGNLRVKASVWNYGSDVSGGLRLRFRWYYREEYSSGNFSGFLYPANEFPPLSSVQPGQPGEIDELILIDDYPILFDLNIASHISIKLYEIQGDLRRPRNQVTFPAIEKGGLPGKLTSIDYLADSDNDGVSDYNENLMETQPNNPNIKPGKAILGIMVLYPDVLGTYRFSEPITSLFHKLEWTNMALKNSDIDAKFQFVKIKRLEAGVMSPDGEYIHGVNLEKVLDNIEVERQKAGGDLMLKVVPKGFSGATVISLEDLERINNTTRISEIMVAQYYAGGASSTLAHELGHLLGLRHSIRQKSSHGGVFRWSRGHGNDGDFTTIMAYPNAYGIFSGHIRQFFSNPNLIQCGKKRDKVCGIDRTQDKAADASLSIRTVMYKVSKRANEPPDDDNDGALNAFDAFPQDPNEIADTDGDKIGDRLDPDDDNDGLSDDEEERLGTNPKVADSDDDSVIDGIDPFPLDNTRSTDADKDGLDASIDANDNDASVTWTRTCVDLTPDATFKMNVIATFDSPADIRSDNKNYQLTGIFANPRINRWDKTEIPLGNELYDYCNNWQSLKTKVGVARVDTFSLRNIAGRGRVLSDGVTGAIKIKNIALTGDYINFMMNGGHLTSDLGVRLLLAGTSTILTQWNPNDERCGLTRQDWRYFDVSALVGQSVDIEIYDNDKNSILACGHDINFDHFYQSDVARGRLVGTASLLDRDDDGVLDGADAFPNDDTETADIDGDGIGDNTDWDDDNDRVPDTDDAFPSDAVDSEDSDLDGLGNYREAAMGTEPDNSDTDGDSKNDLVDVFPLDPTEWLDTDNDGVGDNRDVAPHNDAIAYNCPNCKANQTLHSDAANAAKVIADFDDPLAIQRNSNIHKSSGGKYTLTGVFDGQATAARGWNYFEIQDAEARQRLGSDN